MINPEDWFYCDLCEVQAISCKLCGNSSCNGGGCGECFDDFVLVQKMIAEGTAPEIRTLPVHHNRIYFLDDPATDIPD